MREVQHLEVDQRGAEAHATGVPRRHSLGEILCEGMGWDEMGDARTRYSEGGRGGGGGGGKETPKKKTIKQN